MPQTKRQLAHASHSKPANGKRPVTSKPDAREVDHTSPLKRRGHLSPEERVRARRLARFRIVGVVASGIVLFCAAIIGLVFSARPTTSEVERRALSALPTFDWQDFWDGSYFSDLSLWYSDTYPLREELVAANQALDALHGIETDARMVGGTKLADELPPSTESGDKPSTSPEERKDVEVPNTEEMAAAIQSQITDGLYVKGDTAYNIYYFSQEAVDAYADAINATAEELAGQVQVYSLIAPNSSGIMLPEEESSQLGGTNQADAIDYFYSLYGDDVRSVNAVPYLKKHTDEYIYFRTDHHWTARGAYYAYLAFCDAKGIEPESILDLRQENYGDFLGSFYSQLNSTQMAANPDYVEAWIPKGTNTMTIYDTDGSAETFNVITDTTDWDVLGKTMAFIMGDQPLEMIENPTMTDGSSCLVIKDSFGDFFVPWLVDSYQTVWVADFRYFEGNIKDFVTEHGIRDLIIESNISLAGGGVYAPAILGRL